MIFLRLSQYDRLEREKKHTLDYGAEAIKFLKPISNQILFTHMKFQNKEKYAYSPELSLVFVHPEIHIPTDYVIQKTREFTLSLKG